MNEGLIIDDVEDYAFYQSGLSADGCLEKLDDYTRKAIKRYGEILLEEQKEDFVSGLHTKIKTLEKLLEQRVKDAEEFQEMSIKELARAEEYKFAVEEQKKYIRILEEKLQNNMKLKPIDFKDVKTAILYLDNYKQFGDAIMKANGNPFMILERHNEFLITLANNNISVTANHNWDDKIPCSETKEYEYVDNNETLNKVINEQTKRYENNNWIKRH